MVYQGRVVNIAKFGAFISILPGATGCCTSRRCRPSTRASGSRQVEDVVELGQALEVKVDDVDPEGKVSLSLAGEYGQRRN